MSRSLHVEISQEIYRNARRNRSMGGPIGRTVCFGMTWNGSMQGWGFKLLYLQGVCRVFAQLTYLFASDVDNYHIHYDLVQECRSACIWMTQSA